MINFLRRVLRIPVTPDLSGFRAWVGRQDPDRTYLYNGTVDCALAQYLEERHGRRAYVTPTTVTVAGGETVSLPKELDDIVSGRTDSKYLALTFSGHPFDPLPQRFGDLAKRLEAA